MGVLRFGTSMRRAALDGLARLMDATALEELFTGSDEDALFMLELLRETARGREASCYWEICRTARRRGVTPEYVADRAAVLLGSIEERRRSDVYRVLGVRPLADAEVIRHRWLEIAKREHPDVGGDPDRFRRAKEAYELLKDGRRRGEYERYWLRSLGPFERVASPEDEWEGAARMAEPPAADAQPARRVALVGRPSGESFVRQGAAASEPAVPASERAAPATLAARIADVRVAMAQLDAAEIDRLRREVARRIDALEGLQADLAAVRRLRRVVGAEPDAG